MKVDRGGNVIRAELVNTTGYPELDMKAATYVKEWLFAPDKTRPDEGESGTVKAVLGRG